jgi:predicted P-loop ATPase
MRRPPPSTRLADELADTEGEPEYEHAQLDGDELPGHGLRTVSSEQAWRLKIVTKELRDGAVVTCPIAANVATYLRHHPDWTGVVAYDEFRETIVTLSPPPWSAEDAPANVEAGVWGDGDSSRLRAWLVRVEGVDVPLSEVEQGLQLAADTNRVHPVRAYLDGLVWDGVPRLDAWLVTYVGAPDTLYERGIGPRWMISAVARIFEPGCQVDCVLVLEGQTGAGKTSAFRELVPAAEWYSDTSLDLSNKDSLDNLRSIWIYGLDELDSLRKGEVTRVKNFITARRDHYRPPYAKRARDFLRQNVFGGTTNEDQYLIDRTGNRRFLPVLAAPKVDWQGIARDRDQLWAEAVTRYRAGEVWHIDTPGLRALCVAHQEERVQADPWLEMIVSWLRAPSTRVTETNGGYTQTTLVPLDLRDGVTTAEVLEHCLHVRRADVDQRQSMRVGACLRELGYERERRTVGGERSYRYLRREEPGAELPPERDVDET